ncbi:MAG: hypothetical protein H0Z33_10840 [Bacillaceae bacterium]|nr:hypothetical protein [Bacillaceae bacterium]
MFKGVQSLESLIRSIHQLSSLFDHMDDGLVIADKKGEILYINRSGRNMIRDILEFQLKHRQDNTDSIDYHIDFLDSYIGESLTRQKTFKNEKVTVYRYQESYSLYLSTELIYSEADQLLGVWLTIKNHHRYQNDDTGDFSETFSALGQIAAGVAHEIRNPLTAVSGYLQLAVEELEGHHLQKKFKDIVLPELNHTLEILSDFINMSNPPAPSRKTTTIEDLLQQIIHKITKSCLNHNINLNLNIDSNIPPVRVDEGQMKQVLWQTARSGIDSMPYGGTLSIRAQYLNVVQYVLIQFEDTGLGLKKTDFQQSVISRIIENHGGNLQIDSIRGKGSCVSIYIPPFDESQHFS